MNRLEEILLAVRQRELSVESALSQLEVLRSSGIAPTSDAHVDLAREQRCGFPEVIYGPGKSLESISEILLQQQMAGQASLVTRVASEALDQLTSQFPNFITNRIAKTFRSPSPHEQPTLGNVCVVSGGTSDRPVAEEVLETLHWMNCGCELILDIGVAGPQRLLSKVDRFNECDVVVVVAGMEGALPSVVAGWVACPVIAVPTSVGYGANFAGVSALLAMLTSCAANVSVVNIDAGFKAGYIAGLIARRMYRSANTK